MLLWVAFAIIALSLICVIRVLGELHTLKEAVSRLQRNAIDIDYSLKRGWENNGEKLKRLARRLNKDEALPIYCVKYRNIDRKLYVTSPVVNLLALAREDNISVSSGCYGEGTCGQCAFIPVEGTEHLSPRTAKEDPTIQMFNYPAEARLSCQCQVTGDVTLDLLNPLESLAAAAASDR